MVKLGILDYAQIDEGSSAGEALQHTITLAQLAEDLGYERFWMAEHHNVPAFASSSPELIMMRLADATERIRIGSGGVMIPHYSPYKVAENFRILEAFHPGRIDLGIGNTLGTAIVNRTLNENKKGKLNYEQSIVDLTKYLSDQVDENHRFSGITANPVISTVPQMWVLSTSVRNAKMAANLGIGYTFGLFPIAGIDKIKIGIQAAKAYRENFKPSSFMPEPKVSIAPFVVVAETNEEAKRYAEALDFWLLGTDNFGYLKEFPSVETARNYPYTEKEKAIIQANRTRMVVGDIESVTEQLKALITQFKADEVLLIPLMPGLEARKKAIKLLAGAFN
ncbi:LLM class flavin-dependent oxidoreductase [Virgibacillus profundi]|uniref:LLM class flavin-dependent oxidoreductase n=1 Tax=Virgibacillus profundi TaxID=2024555 RepID=A0A2A2IAQ8_9BACI|nr:LLM class flavin-dependent oxidoreductase [Virgibacillus profundi]PAV28143.1 LLM class flavin-dependent oxidoreductase [Virgibacillus profundi]PXY52448.1 LLM class flavin-dependent oxidoreductase [Virgibacillus profundi]